MIRGQKEKKRTFKPEKADFQSKIEETPMKGKRKRRKVGIPEEKLEGKMKKRKEVFKVRNKEVFQSIRNEGKKEKETMKQL